ncbi:MAG: amidohydrolase [Kutzneria sp.]|nr:amidohydrolase [Kutzneria sp.]
MTTTHSADLILHSGAIFGTTRAATAMAVHAGTVVAVGGDAEVLQHAGPRTQFIDLAGRLVTPGFIDAHVHPGQAGLEQASCDLSGCAELADVAAVIRDYAATTDRPWITGGGWRVDMFDEQLPTRALLDRLVDDRPAFLMSGGHHSAWVNSRALELAGITAASPDPPNGHVERDPDGTPTGVLHEGAMILVERLTPTPTQADIEDALLAVQEYLFSLGVTGWQDAILGNYAGVVDATEAYCALEQSGRLRAQVTGALWWDRARGLEQIPDLLQRREQVARSRSGGVGGFTARTVKILQDGVVGNFTAALGAPYLDADGRPGTNTGLSHLAPAHLAAVVTALDAADFQVHIHAIGDRAVRESLDAFAAARAANGHRGNRHHIAHLNMIDPVDLPRFAELDLTANLQMLWAYRDEYFDRMVRWVGPERAGWHFLFGSLARAGARLAAGSDWPVSTPNPLAALHVAVNRREPGSDGPPLGMGEELSVDAALRAYTAGSAYLMHDDSRGQIEVGHPADFAVIDRDIRTVPSEQIGEARVELTFVRGEPVWTADV